MRAVTVFALGGVALVVVVLLRTLIARGDDGPPPRQASGPAAAGPYRKPTEGELMKRLTPLQWKVTQKGGTEPPFQNEYWNNKAPGIYVDLATGEPLFASTHKYVSGTGWPSFTQPLVPENIVRVKDSSWGRTRVEVRSRHGDCHLGHVFTDGPAPTGLRYCMNSAALRFVPARSLVAEGYGAFVSLFPGQAQVGTPPPSSAKAAKLEASREPATPSEEGSPAEPAEPSKPTTPVVPNPSSPAEEPGPQPQQKRREVATLAGGCFWGVEDIVRKVPGVVETEVGYTGGSLEHPHYPDVKTGRTGHAESVRVVFDPARVSYGQILDLFFRLHDPTTKNRQGNDRGTQYRSAIFVHSPAQRAAAEAALKRAAASGRWKDPIVTEISDAGPWTPAEEYHQDYLVKHPGGYTCHWVRD